MRASDEIAAINFWSGASRNAPLRRRDERIFGREELRDLLALHEFGIGGRALRASFENFAIGGGEMRRIRVPLPCGDGDQGITSGGRYAAQLQVHCWSGAAAKSAHVKRNELCVAHDEANGIERHTKFFSNSLGKGSANILADFHFAGENGDVFLIADVQPGIDFLGKRILGVSPRSATRFLKGSCFGSSANDEKAGAEEFEKGTAIGFKKPRRTGGEFVTLGLDCVGEKWLVGHGRASGIASAALRMAATMRG